MSAARGLQRLAAYLSLRPEHTHDAVAVTVHKNELERRLWHNGDLISRSKEGDVTETVWPGSATPLRPMAGSMPGRRRKPAVTRDVPHQS